VPEFKDLVNVIVFPSTGDRPLCNMMAGGDLDGDVYFVCWDKCIMDHLTPEVMQAPVKYSKPTIIHEKPREETIADYFTFYLERDVLGQLANLHLAYCDLLGRKGPLKDICVRLSGLQAIAVDFAKHGECVPRAEFQDLLKKLDEWPDFF
jgi:RNA-dependent RNA polymerase